MVLSVTDIGSQRQFWFNSQELIVNSDRIRILQERPAKHPRNPILVADRPWEGSLLQLQAAVDYNPHTGQWQMWYEAHPSEALLCTAFSSDGIHWRKPSVGVLEWNGTTDNNIILQTGYWDAYQHSVVKSPNEADPARRYKMYYWVATETYNPNNPVVAAVGYKIKDYHRNGWYVAFSGDGIHWTPQADVPVLAGQCAAGRVGKNPLVTDPTLVEDPWMTISDVNAVIFDEQCGRYRSYHKLDKQNPGWDKSRRCLGMCESDDGLSFGTSIPILDPSAEDDAWAQAHGALRAEFYGLHVWPQNGFYLGLVNLFEVYKTGQPPYGVGWDDGPISPQLVYSPDGIVWHRLPVREPFIPLGPAGSFEQGTLFSGDRPVTIGNEVHFHYSAASYSHGWTEPINSPNQYTGIGLAILPRDRYVGWQGGSVAGMLLTEPIRFSGRELRLNLDASRGHTRVALLGPEGNPLPGYTLDDCMPISTDNFDQVVDWRGRRDLSALSEKPLRLQFELCLATLYTWQFTE